MRLGIFGGSFDPVHHGHLALARACQQQAALDEVWFTPTGIQPLKKRGPMATDVDRVEMLNLAIEFEPSWRVCTLEIDRGGISYTVETLRQLRVELPEASLFFMIGADAVRDVPRWKEPAEFFRLAKLLVVHRAGEPAADLTSVSRLSTAENQPMLIEMAVVDVSSTEIRRRVAANEPINGMVPLAVEQYIFEHALYSTK
jgi:nicotinate-nucleotide adenylyltransferase